MAAKHRNFTKTEKEKVKPKKNFRGFCFELRGLS